MKAIWLLGIVLAIGGCGHPDEPILLGSSGKGDYNGPLRQLEVLSTKISLATCQRSETTVTCSPVASNYLDGSFDPFGLGMKGTLAVQLQTSPGSILPKKQLSADGDARWDIPRHHVFPMKLIVTGSFGVLLEEQRIPFRVETPIGAEGQADRIEVTAPFGRWEVAFVAEDVARRRDRGFHYLLRTCFIDPVYDAAYAKYRTADARPWPCNQARKIALWARVGTADIENPAMLALPVAGEPISLRTPAYDRGGKISKPGYYAVTLGDNIVPLSETEHLKW